MDESTGFGLFISTFVAVFVAELGDKTQLATLALSSGAPSWRARGLVLAGAALALTTTSVIGVLAGGWLARFISPAVLQRCAGALFVVLGILMLVRRPG